MPEALYRKYRPQVFADVVGQEPIERTLKNALEQGKVSHAYLFTGPRGTGKTTTARLLAKALLCQSGPTADPDGTCEDCLLIAEGGHPDVYELDAASRTGVENVREEIISRVQYAPTRGRSKVYIIDEVHMLSTAAFNALLKTLEEPPGHVVFILCTTDPQKVPETIHSRCQRFDFRRIAPESIVTRLGAICVAEGVEFEGEALDLIAQRAEGGLRNALTSLEQIIAFENGSITLAGAERLLGSIDSNDMAEVMALIGRRDIAGCFRWVSDYAETGADLAQFVRDMAQHARDLYILALSGDDAAIDVPETTRASLTAELQWFGPDRASRLLGVLGDLAAELKTSSNPRLSFEIALTRMVRPDSDITLEALAERVEALEGGYSAVAHRLPDEREGAAAAASAATAAPAAMQALATEAAVPPGPAAAQAPLADAAPAAQPAAAASPAAQPSEPSSASGAQAAPAPADAVAGQYPAADVPEAPAAAVQPQPAAEPAVAGSPRAASLANPAALQRIWQAAFAEIKKMKQAHAVLFMNVKATYDEASGGIRLVFPPEATFAYSNVQKPEVQRTVAEALLKAVGEGVPFSFAQGADGQQAASVAVPAAEPVPAAAPAAAQQAQTASGGAPSGSNAAQPTAPAAEAAASPAAQAPSGAPEAPAAGSAPSTEPTTASRQEAPLPADDLPPYDDEPPVSVYEDYAASYDAAPSEPAVAEPTSAEPVRCQPASRPQPGFAAADVPEGDAGLDDVQALLQNGFGGGIVFEEVDE